MEALFIMEDIKKLEMDKRLGALALVRAGEARLDDKPYYSHDCFCPNCLKMTTLQIPIGQLAIDYETNHKCSRCGCTPEQFRGGMMRNGLMAVKIPQ